MTMTRSALRTFSVPTLGLLLTLATFSSIASAQAPAPRAKEPTDGFFDVPARPPGEESEPWGLPAYMIIGTLAGGAIMALCKSARRS